MFMFYIVNKIIEFVYNYLINCFIWKYMLSYYFLKKNNLYNFNVYLFLNENNNENYYYNLFLCFLVL